MSWVRAHAKVNLALVVGGLRDDGMHEIVTVLQRVGLYDDVGLEASDDLTVEGFADDTLVTAALSALADRVGIEPRWSVRIEKQIPVAAGLGGGSSDAAAALLLGNASLAAPLAPDELHLVARDVGADVPFFLRDGAQLATGDGTILRPLELPRDYVALLVLPHGETKTSTGDVYRSFDGRRGEAGFEERRARLEAALGRVAKARELAALPPNDLVSSPLAEQLVELGAFRADVSGAGPAIYGLFEDEEPAERARGELASLGRIWLTRPV